MATQRLTIATVAGDAGAHVAILFQSWRNKPPAPEVVDQFCERLRVNGSMLPVIYYAEWIDRWLMGDLVPGPTPMAGRRYEAACLTPEQAVQWAEKCGTQFAEQFWFEARLREAAASSAPVVTGRTVVVLREVLGSMTIDAEALQALKGVPAWLSADLKRDEQYSATERVSRL